MTAALQVSSAAHVCSCCGVFFHGTASEERGSDDTFPRPPSSSRKVSLVPDRLWESLSKLHEHRHECNERPEEPKEYAAVHGIILSASRAAPWTACHGVRSHVEAAALVTECSIPLV